MRERDEGAVEDGGKRLKILMGKYAGFCFGVEKAVKAVKSCLKSEEHIYTYGPIIHNRIVVEQLLESGAVPVEGLEGIGGCTLVIRSHGAPPSVYKECRERGIRVVDATCPFVKRIHETVRTHSEAGEEIIIIGDKNHPEVIGTNGWSGGKARILYTPEDVAAMPQLESACVVAQTTIPLQKWEEIVALLKDKVAGLKLFNTICETTVKRQEEAVELAKQANIMLVIGGKDSANTQRLADGCRKHCSKTFVVEQLADLPLEIMGADDIIGVVTGASTPEGIIREVIARMDELEKSPERSDPQEVKAPDEEVTAETGQEDDADFAQSMEKTLVRIRAGQIIKGTVVQITDNEVCVNIGYKSDGLIPANELSLEGEVNPYDLFKIGDEISVEIIKVNDGEGNVILSKKKVDARRATYKYIENIENGEIFEAVVKEAVKGGLVALCKGFIKVFIPASHVSDRFEPDLSKYVGETMKLKALEVEKKRRRIVASHKLILQEEQKMKEAEIWEALKPGERIKGKVMRLTDFGAFVDIGGVDGLIHISDLSWGKVKHPSDIVHPGDIVEMEILSVDPERRRVSLGYKQCTPKPWETVPERFLVGAIVEGRVARIVPFGAFVELAPGIDGLIHISQISSKRIDRVESELKPGDIVRVKVLEVNLQDKRISLSRKEALLEEKLAEPSDQKPDTGKVPEELVPPQEQPAPAAEEVKGIAAEETKKPAVEKVAETVVEIVVKKAAKTAAKASTDESGKDSPDKKRKTSGVKKGTAVGTAAEPVVKKAVKTAAKASTDESGKDSPDKKRKTSGVKKETAVKKVIEGTKEAVVKEAADEKVKKPRVKKESNNADDKSA
ncbi:MAG: bifunctional 4-hydroxy-3-methylbut-2-enyl diphosphate reductase/30S ribosomal protein S1 [Bacillota bacterium]|nr:bifunctional 4-hydroxy-3-methylbut-2-enyl diphosphate reductase/30S ribosomal protein S1 [Bacillota bacterium]